MKPGRLGNQKLEPSFGGGNGAVCSDNQLHSFRLDRLRPSPGPVSLRPRVSYNRLWTPTLHEPMQEVCRPSPPPLPCCSIALFEVTPYIVQTAEAQPGPDSDQSGFPSLTAHISLFPRPCSVLPCPNVDNERARPSHGTSCVGQHASPGF
jgi:hypothetical protein